MSLCLYVFVGWERASVMGVCHVTDPPTPRLTQLLASRISQEGIVAVPGRNLLPTDNKGDLSEVGGICAPVMLFHAGEGPASDPMLTAGGPDGLGPAIWGGQQGSGSPPESDLRSCGDKGESFAIDAAGHSRVMTDHDGADDSSGVRYSWSEGQLRQASEAGDA